MRCRLSLLSCMCLIVHQGVYTVTGRREISAVYRVTVHLRTIVEYRNIQSSTYEINCFLLKCRLIDWYRNRPLYFTAWTNAGSHTRRLWVAWDVVHFLHCRLYTGHRWTLFSPIYHAVYNCGILIVLMFKALAYCRFICSPAIVALTWLPFA